jgi:hypothetical protein
MYQEMYEIRECMGSMGDRASPAPFALMSVQDIIATTEVTTIPTLRWNVYNQTQQLKTTYEVITGWTSLTAGCTSLPSGHTCQYKCVLVICCIPRMLTFAGCWRHLLQSCCISDAS